MTEVNFKQLIVLVAKSKWTDEDLSKVETTLVKNPDFCSKKLKANLCTYCCAWRESGICSLKGCQKVSHTRNLETLLY